MAFVSSSYSIDCVSENPIKTNSEVTIQLKEVIHSSGDSTPTIPREILLSEMTSTSGTVKVASEEPATLAPKVTHIVLSQIEPKDAAVKAIEVMPMSITPAKASDITMEPLNLAKTVDGIIPGKDFSQNIIIAQPDDSLAKSKVIRSISQIRGASKLKKMLDETDELIVCPGVYDGVSARVARSMGFNAMYMTGAGTTASRLGMADLGIAQLHDMREHAEMIANLEPYGPPLIADMDTGYGGPIMVANSVSQYIRAGVAGFHIEDQIQNKRCGHLQGKKVVPAEEFYMRIRAAKGAKDRLQSDIVLIARTDANQQHGYDECIRRLKGARDLGADVGLLEGFTSREQAKQAVQELAPWPLLLNMVENGATPIITTTEAKEMGFRIMIFSFASLAPAVVAIRNTFQKILTSGVVGTGKELTPKALFEICGLNDSMTIDFEAGGAAFQEV